MPAFPVDQTAAAVQLVESAGVVAGAGAVEARAAGVRVVDARCTLGGLGAWVWAAMDSVSKMIGIVVLERWVKSACFEDANPVDVHLRIVET